MKLLVFLPAFNEEATIPGVLGGLPRALPGVDAVEWLVVDDGSTDRTAELAAAAGARVVRHQSNQGVGTAFHTAVEHALRCGADAMVTIDADGQFDPAQIPEVAGPVLAGDADLVTGCRFEDGARPPSMPVLKYRGNLLVAGLLRLLAGVELADVSCGFRAYGREALLHLNLFGKFTYTQEAILDLTFKGLRIAEVPVRVRYFPDRKSRVAGSLLRYAVNALKIITRTVRDFRPLRFFGSLGLAVFFLGVALDLWLLVHYLRTGAFTPFKAVGFAGGTLNVCGILLAGLGLLADMLDRIRGNQERLLYYHKRQLFGAPREAVTVPPESREAAVAAGPAPVSVANGGVETGS